MKWCCRPSFTDRIKHNRLIADTKGHSSDVLPIGKLIRSRVKSLEQLYGDIECFRYKTTPSFDDMWGHYGGSKTALFARGAVRISRYRHRIICRRGSGQGLHVNSIVPLFVKHYNDPSPGSTDRLSRAGESGETR